MKKIPLIKGGFAIVDNSTFKKVMRFCWYVDAHGYAVSNLQPQKKMHRLIMGFPKSGIDHKNGNKLDNRIANLRICSQKENQANSKKGKNNTSGFKGVSWDKSRKKWRAYLTKNYKQQFIGRFDDKKEAAKAYNNRARKEFGNFCKLNKV